MRQLGISVAIFALFCCVALTWGCAVDNESTGAAKLTTEDDGDVQAPPVQQASEESYFLQSTVDGNALGFGAGVTTGTSTFVIEVTRKGQKSKINIKTKKKNGKIRSECDSIEVDLESKGDGNSGNFDVTLPSGHRVEGALLFIDDKNKPLHGGHMAIFVSETKTRTSNRGSEQVTSVFPVTSRATGYPNDIVGNYHKITFDKYQIPNRQEFTDLVPKEDMEAKGKLRDLKRDTKLDTKAKDVQQAFGSGSNCGGSPSGDSTTRP